MGDWKKKGHPGISSHLERMWKAELELEKEHVACLGASVIMLDLMIDLVIESDDEADGWKSSPRINKC